MTSHLNHLNHLIISSLSSPVSDLPANIAVAVTSREPSQAMGTMTVWKLKQCEACAQAGTETPPEQSRNQMQTDRTTPKPPRTTHCHPISIILLSIILLSIISSSITQYATFQRAVAVGNASPRLHPSALPSHLNHLRSITWTILLFLSI